MLYETPNPHGGDLYSREIRLDFSANINPYGTPQAVKDAVAGSVEALRCYPDPYCRGLVKAIAAFEQVDPRRILCGNGAAELIFSCCMALRPRKALVLSPCFSEYETALQVFGTEVDHYLLRQEANFALTEEFLNDLERFDGELLMLCNPNNPTGQVTERPLMEKILEVCRRKGIFLFIDECFLDLTQGGEGVSMKPFLERTENLLLLKAFTKSYGMAGLRLGYCLTGNERLLKTMGRQVQPWNVSIPAQAAGIAALGAGEFLQKANDTIHTQRPILSAALERLGFTVIPSRTNYILFHADRELRAPLLEQGIQIRSCANYIGLGEGWYRVAVKLPEENEQLVEALERVIEGGNTLWQRTL